MTPTPTLRARIPQAPLDLLERADAAAAILPPLRRQILVELREPDSATGVARSLGLPRQRVHYHVRELEREGLVREVGERKRGNCIERLVQATARHYLIAPQALGSLAADPTAIEDHFSSEYLAALASAAIRDLGHLRAQSGDSTARVPTLSLQSEIRFASAADRRAFAEELTEVLAGLVAKYHDEEAPEGRTFRFLLGAYPAPEEAPPPPSDGP